MKDKTRDPDIYIRLFKACGCFVESTLTVETNAIAQLTDYDRLIARPELKYPQPAGGQRLLAKAEQSVSGRKARTPRFFRQLYADEKVLVKRLYLAGVHVVAGTDALNPMIVPGAIVCMVMSSPTWWTLVSRPIRR